MEAHGSPSKPISYMKKIEDHITKLLIGGLITGLTVTVAFYFNTNASLANHSEKLINHDDRIENVEKTQASIISQPAVAAEQINSIKEMVIEIRDRQRLTEARQDKMYDVILELSKKK